MRGEKCQDVKGEEYEGVKGERCEDPPLCLAPGILR